MNPHPHSHPHPLDELVRIESDPAYRALFCAELDAAIVDRFANRAAVVAEVQAAADRLRDLVRHGEPGRSA
ncbi:MULTISPECIES: hypothetical protein [Streptomyces]|uniref:Uncharacterized protein n=1 Tax=Streptomyces durocortorensis TaxID=2811104 RepID=A0ABS2I7B9_9ACTN|nr:hypothetical protein [Streptomyces durocortorensis]MBM7057757.1 hypothetical protein [Streptomyces durocortorensis]